MSEDLSATRLTPVSPRSQSGRVAGIDIARGIALLGMLVVHAAPDQGLWEVMLSAGSQRSRILFAVTAGMGLAVLTSRAFWGTSRSDRQSVRRTLAIRALYLLVLGWLLTMLAPPISVILDEFGVAFLVLLPLLFLRSTPLLIAGGLGVALAPALAVAIADHIDITILFSNQLAAQLAQWLAIGSYPVFTWVAIMLFTMGVVRSDLRTAAAHTWVALGGAFLGIATLIARGMLESLPLFAEDSPLNESLLVVGNVSLCLALVMGLITITRFGPTSRIALVVLAPLSAIGSMPLTIYTGQAIALWAATSSGALGDPRFASMMIITVALVSILFAVLWKRFISRRGPLEWIDAWLSDRNTPLPPPRVPAPGTWPANRKLDQHGSPSTRM